MQLTQRQVEVFRAIMLSRSVTKAAEALHSSQPTTSRILADLERTLGFKLFVRDRKRMVPTPEAIALFEEVQRHFVGLARIEKAATRIRQLDDRTLRVATIPSVSFGLLPLVVPPFRANYPHSRLDIEVHTYESVLHNVMTGQCEIGFTAYAADIPGLHIERILSSEAVCVMARGSPLCAAHSVHARDLEGLPFVSLESHAPSRARIDRVFERYRVNRDLALETQNGAVICALVKRGSGVAVMDPLSAYSFKDPDLVVRPFRPKIPFDFYVLWRRDAPLSRFAEAFLAEIRRGTANPVAEIPSLEVVG